MQEYDSQNSQELSTGRQKGNAYVYWILLAGILVCITLVRLRLLSIPLERDEGEYGYMGQLLLQGIPPYQEAFNMKLPGTNMMYAFFMLLFGETTTAIHLGLLLVNLTSIVLLFLLARKWICTPAAGIVAAASFGSLTFSYAFLGFAAHATHFIVVFALAGIILLEKAIEQRRSMQFFLAGIFFGCAFLMKQPGIFFFCFGMSLLIWESIKNNISKRELLRSGIILSGGFSIPLVIVVGIIIYSGTWQQFWFWVFQYAFKYGQNTTVKEGLRNLGITLRVCWDVLPLFCVLTGAGIITIITGRFQRPLTVKALLLTGFSLLAVIPGWHFRDHYFIVCMPAFAIAIACVFQYLRNILRPWHSMSYVWVTLIVLVFCYDIYSNRMYYFILSPVDIVRDWYEKNFFAESETVSNFLAAHTKPDERIAIVGSEPQIFFYAKRKSVSGFIYVYGMMEPQPYARRMQEEFIRDIEHARPRYIVYIRILYSWFARNGSDMHIFHWQADYIRQYYRTVGILDLITPYDVRFIQGPDALHYPPMPNDAIFIYERKDAAP